MGHSILYRKKYLSDLTDEQWAILAPLIPPHKHSASPARPAPHA
jgi:transposase